MMRGQDDHLLEKGVGVKSLTHAIWLTLHSLWRVFAINIPVV